MSDVKNTSAKSKKEKKRGHEKAKILFVSMWAMLFVVVGFVLVALSVHLSDSGTTELFESKLTEIAALTDRSLSVSFERARSDLEYICNFNGGEAEKKWIEGDSSYLESILENFPTRDEAVVAVCNRLTGEIVYISDSGITGTEMKFRATSNDYAYVTIDGEPYIAFFRDSEKCSLRYAFMLDTDGIFESYSPSSESGERFFLALVNNDTGTAYNGESAESDFRIYTAEEIKERNDGLTISYEWSEDTGYTEYEFTDSKTNELISVGVSVIPKRMSKNGVFTVSVAISRSSYDENVEKASIHMALGVLLAVIGFMSFVYLFIGAARRSSTLESENDKIKARAEKVTRMLKETRELEHLQRLESIGMMTSSIAHEFNNMLTPIMGYSADLLANADPDDEKTIDSLGEIYEASSRAKRLINRISFLSRKGNAEARELISADELILKLRDMFTAVCPKNVEMELDLHSPAKNISGEFTQLVQLFTNLFINATHAMKEKGGTVTLSTLEKDNTVEISVRDTGVGMSEEIMSKIFDPFFTTKPVNEGTGLGLAIVWQIAESHEAKISVDSTVGVGSVFTVSFPKYKGEIPEEE